MDQISEKNQQKILSEEIMSELQTVYKAQIFPVEVIQSAFCLKDKKDETLVVAEPLFRPIPNRVSIIFEKFPKYQ